MPNHKKVIPFKLEWRFFDYLEGANNPIEAWYLGLSEDFGRDIFDNILKGNQKADTPLQWNDCTMLQGEAKQYGIWEWRFYADDRQQRLLGVFGAERKHAVFLIGCTHKQRIYTPPSCIETAIRRAKEVIARRAVTRERKVKKDI